MADGDGLTGPTVVYLCCDAGVLRYVGITKNFKQRRQDHRRYSWWWTPGTEMRMHLTFDERADAEDEERRLIEELHPPFNIIFNHPDACQRRPGWVEIKKPLPAPLTGESAALAAVAAEHHRASLATSVLVDDALAERDALVRELRAEDAIKWSYNTLAREVGCSKELIAAIVKGRTGRKREAS